MTIQTFVMLDMKKKKITQKNLERAVNRSSKIEGLSLARAKKNSKVIKLLQKHGRAFSISR